MCFYVLNIDGPLLRGLHMDLKFGEFSSPGAEKPQAPRSWSLSGHVYISWGSHWGWNVLPYVQYANLHKEAKEVREKGSNRDFNRVNLLYVMSTILDIQEATWPGIWPCITEWLVPWGPMRSKRSSKSRKKPPNEVDLQENPHCHQMMCTEELQKLHKFARQGWWRGKDQENAPASSFLPLEETPWRPHSESFLFT